MLYYPLCIGNRESRNRVAIRREEIEAVNEPLLRDIHSYLAAHQQGDTDTKAAVTRSYWGNCPECGVGGEVFLNDGRDHWLICYRDGVKWYVGSNLFSIWRDLSPEEMAWQRSVLATYRDVTA